MKGTKTQIKTHFHCNLCLEKLFVLILVSFRVLLLSPKRVLKRPGSSGSRCDALSQPVGGRVGSMSLSPGAGRALVGKRNETHSDLLLGQEQD